MHRSAAATLCTTIYIIYITTPSEAARPQRAINTLWDKLIFFLEIHTQSPSTRLRPDTERIKVSTTPWFKEFSHVHAERKQDGRLHNSFGKERQKPDNVHNSCFLLQGWGGNSLVTVPLFCQAQRLKSQLMKCHRRSITHSVDETSAQLKLTSSYISQRCSGSAKMNSSWRVCQSAESAEWRMPWWAFHFPTYKLRLKWIEPGKHATDIDQTLRRRGFMASFCTCKTCRHTKSDASASKAGQGLCVNFTVGGSRITDRTGGLSSSTPGVCGEGCHMDKWIEKAAFLPEWQIWCFHLGRLHWIKLIFSISLIWFQSVSMLLKILTLWWLLQLEWAQTLKNLEKVKWKRPWKQNEMSCSVHCYKHKSAS